MKRRERDRGAVLIIVLIFAVIVATFCMTSLMVSTMESQGTHAAVQRDKAFFVASAGLHDQISMLSDMMNGTASSEPFKAFEVLAGQTTIDRRTLMSGELAIGEYTVRVGSITSVSNWERDMVVTSTGWVPSPDHPKAVTRSVTAVLRLAFTRSEVFDYVYFINNWGWYYGNTIIANGNVRANGQFDFGGCSPTVNGLPRFESLADGSFGEKLDDGGVYAGWNIVNSSRVRGDTSSEASMHAFSNHVPMPNLTDMTFYEDMARSRNSAIRIDGEVVADSVVGDDVKEKRNLYLEGTKKKPIELNGPVVVRGDLIIRGYIVGKGALYVQGNVYVAGDLIYSNPIQNIPEVGDADKLTSWIDRNASADALGLFAREHIVVGDFTDSRWQDQVSRWVYDQRNSSEEDAGEDGIPNTRAGRDGILGTADDDILEGDDVFTALHYTIEDLRAGRIPEGFKVGDIVPGSGEDIDGDGKYDPGTQMSEFDIRSPLTSSEWAGNFPGGKNLTYKNLCQNNHTISRLDGAFYTNHTFAMLTLNYGQDLVINGTIVSRNEAIIYGTKHAVFNYDARLLSTGNAYGDMLPKNWKPVKMVMWRSN